MQDDTLRPVGRALAGAGQRAQEWKERLLGEMKFARGLTRLHPEKAEEWRELIERAEEAVVEAVDDGGMGRLPDAVRQAEDMLAPVAEVAGQYTVHCVGHAHIDMNWMWSWPETVATTNDTFTTVLKLMEEFDDFCFTQSQCSVYEIMERYNPQMLERIKERVAEGRWEVAAAHWVEGDKNLASGESLARHLLYSRRYVKDLFGLEPEEQPLDWEPDTFGHALTIPSIVSRGAVKRYYMCRGGAADKPPVFWWQGPDGSRILVYLEISWYNDSVCPANATALLEFCEETGLKDWMNVYGVGDHGGGPTREDIVKAHRMDAWPVFPNFRLSTASAFYDILEEHGDSWPVLEQELNFEFTGCYTSQSRLKKANRLGENYCVEAEAAAVLAQRVLGCDYPAEQLRAAWIDTLFGHFHDILPGSGVAATVQHQMARFQESAAATGMVKTQSLRALASVVDTSFGEDVEETPPESGGVGAGPGFGSGLSGVSGASHAAGPTRPFLVFNPLAQERREVVTATVWDPPEPDLSYVVRDGSGQLMRAQKLDERDYWGHHRVDLAFPAAVGSMGYSVCRVEPGSTHEPEDAVRCRAESPSPDTQHPRRTVLENGLIEAVFDPTTGGVTRLVDKATGRDLADPERPLGVLEYVLERPHAMASWVINEPIRCERAPEVTSFEADKTGPYVASLVAKTRVRDSDITVTYTLRAGSPLLEIEVEARWVEIGGPKEGTPTLRMAFPLALTDCTGRYEIPFGSMTRDMNDGQEVPALRWAHVAGRSASEDEPAGLTLLNDCKYGHSLDGSTLRLTLIRSSYNPDPFPEVGQHSMRMAVRPHGEAPDAVDLCRLGAAFNHPLQIIATDAHEGELPSAAAAVTRIEPAGAVLTSMKQCEDDSGVILRLCELTGRSGRTTVGLNPELLGEPKEITEVDLLERPLASSTAKITEDGFSVEIPSHGIASVRVRFA
ncbi:MAG: glycoside hydrolase family 38 C-terminal domain-containing protein [Candidatus Brocadiia bacterium]